MNRPTSSQNIIFISVVGFCWTIVCMGGCSRESTAEQPPAKRPPMVVNVVGFKALQEDVKDTISVIGSLESNESVDIKSEINGTIESINFIEGASVKKGDVLFQIEKRKLKAAFDQSRANLKLAQTTADRYERLVKSKAVSQQEYDQAVATLASSQATLDLSQEQLEDATITAPFDGVMGERLISTGQFISQGTLLSFLFNKDPMKVKFNVPERYLSVVKHGLKVNVKVAAYQDKIFEGQVYFVDQKIDETTRTVLVKATIPNPEGELREGMFANLDLIVEVRQDTIVVPETALIIKGDSVSVYVVGDEDMVELRTVQPGKRSNGMVEISKGLTAGEVIVIEGYQKIGPGSKVKVRFEDVNEKKFYEII